MAVGRREKASYIVGISLICLSILTVIALTAGPETVGRVNLRLKTVILPYLNALGWILPVLGVYWGWKLIVGGPYRRAIIFSAFVFMIYLTVSTFSYLGMPKDESGALNVGGLGGWYLAAKVVGLFGPYGAGLVVVAGLMVLFILTTGLSLRRGAVWLERNIKDIGVAAFGRGDDAPERPKPRISKRPAPKKVAAVKVRPESEPETEPEPEPEDIPPLAERVRIPPRVMPARQEAESQQELELRAPHRVEEPEEGSEYMHPAISLFEDVSAEAGATEEELQELASYLEEKIRSFDVNARVVEIHPGPVITRFEIEPGSSTKVHQVVNLADDLALALKARSLRILAPIPGKGTIGIEVPNKHPSMVGIKEILVSSRFTSSPSKLELALGKDVSGIPYTADLEAMPHLLIAGATGSGKSVCINTIITSLVYRNSPQDVQLLLIDPKRLELSTYEGIPHLVCEVVTEAKKAVRALAWVVEEMDMRYQILARRGVRNIQSYTEGLPYIVVIIDELADLMLMVPQEIETAVTKLAQMARAVGIHLVLATQRPSVDVITGVIKANFPCRIAFKVASKTDSRTILDHNGAERLLGKGDMLFLPPATAEPIRLHGAFVSNGESQRLVEFLRQQGHLASPAFSLESMEHHDFVPVDQRDELFEDAARIVITHQQGSVSLLQRRLKVGYSRAARLIDFLEEAGIVGPFEGSKARQVLVDESYLEDLSGKL
jgi:S-DNA-T family DNA segregation ATPase FtsK/SpoIIIE